MLKSKELSQIAGSYIARGTLCILTVSIGRVGGRGGVDIQSRARCSGAAGAGKCHDQR